MESVYHIVAICVNETSWAHVWRLHFRYLGTGYDSIVHKTFSDHISDLVEVYVDDIVVRIKSCASLLDNFTLVFDWVRSTHAKLNPDKCVFGVTVGKLLVFLVSYQGIEANSKKIKTIEAMRPPTHIKDVQKLTACLAMLSRFISRLAKRAPPFFKLLRKSGPFIWIEEAEEEFQELKRYLTSPPIMVALKPSEPLLLYIVVTADVVSMVLVAERPEPCQNQEPKVEEAPRSQVPEAPQPRNFKMGLIPSPSPSSWKPIQERPPGPSS
jgi:hypothetical protein